MLTFCRKRRNKREFGRTKADCDDVEKLGKFQKSS